MADISHWLGVLCALLITVAVLALWPRSGINMPLDKSGDRSLHVGEIPRIGGGAMLLGCGVALFGTYPAREFFAFPLVAVLVAAMLALISLLDDWRPLPITPRIAVHLLGALVAAGMLDLPLPQTLLAVVVIVWMTNLYNFMDGADGLAGGMTVFGFGAYGVMAYSTLPVLSGASFVIAAAALGFLLFNFPPARLFLGDAGSIPLGFLAATFGLVGWHSGVWPVWFPLLLFSVFIVDASATLLTRMCGAKKFWIPHKDHYYQRLIRMGWTHRKLACMAYLVMFASALSAVALVQFDSLLQYFGMALWCGVYVLAMLAINSRWRKSQGEMS